MEEKIDVKPKSEYISKKIVAVEMVRLQKQIATLGTAVIVAAFLTLLTAAFNVKVALFSVSLISFVGVFVIFRAKKEMQRLKTKYDL